MGGINQNSKRSLFLFNISLIIIIAGIVGGSVFYNRYSIRYEKELNSFVNYIYDEETPDDLSSIYHQFMSLDPIYRSRMEKDLADAMINRYEHYADLYLIRKVEYSEYKRYETMVKLLFESNERVNKKIAKVTEYYNSENSYLEAMNLQKQGLIEEAVHFYNQVLFDDSVYYDLAKEHMAQCIQLIQAQYLIEASTFYEQKEYVEAIKRLDYLIENGNDESVNSLKWYYQSELYIESIKKIEQLTKENRFTMIIRYLNEIKPYLGSDHQEALNLTLTDMTLKRAQRRDAILEKYASKIKILRDEEINQRVITYSELSSSDSIVFNPLYLVMDSFRMMKNEKIKCVEDEVAEQNINIMPYVIASSDMTDASLFFIVGHYHEEMNEFTKVNFYQDNDLLLGFEIDSLQKHQVVENDQIIEWASVELHDDMIEKLEQMLQETKQLKIVFEGESLDHEFPVSMLEYELMKMMLDIHQSIVR